jgi:hypothetical protein
LREVSPRRIYVCKALLDAIFATSIPRGVGGGQEEAFNPPGGVVILLCQRFIKVLEKTFLFVHLNPLVSGGGRC